MIYFSCFFPEKIDSEFDRTYSIYKENSVGNLKEVSSAVITRKKNLIENYNLIFNLQCTERLHNEEKLK